MLLCCRPPSQDVSELVFTAASRQRSKEKNKPQPVETKRTFCTLCSRAMARDDNRKRWSFTRQQTAAAAKIT